MTEPSTHVEVDKHFINEKIEDNSIELPFVRSEDQLTVNRQSIYSCPQQAKHLLTLRGSVRILLSENISKNIIDNQGSIKEYQ